MSRQFNMSDEVHVRNSHPAAVRKPQRKCQRRMLRQLWFRWTRRPRLCHLPLQPLIMASRGLLGEISLLESFCSRLFVPSKVSLPSINIYNVEYAELPAECHGGLATPAPLPASIPLDKIMSNIEPCLMLRSFLVVHLTALCFSSPVKIQQRRKTST